MLVLGVYILLVKKENKIMKFKPILAPNEQPKLENINYPILASYKLDGIRCIVYKGQLLSRSLKPIQNKQLKKRLKPIADYCEKYSLILDGEIYSPDLTFQEITRYVMTQDFEDKKSVKKFGKILEIPESLKFYCFDCLKIKADGIENHTPFMTRLGYAIEIYTMFKTLMVFVKHERVDNLEEVRTLFEEALEGGYEGLILRYTEGYYKFGRCTIKEGNIFKVKPFRTFDAVIKEVTQGTVVNPNAEKKINELGRSVTSKKKDDRILVNKVRDFVVDYNGHELKVTSSSLTHEERERLWNIRETLIGKTIEYKGMLIGSKNTVRHPVFIRFREDKDEK
jgi:DNA ligase-1